MSTGEFLTKAGAASWACYVTSVLVFVFWALPDVVTHIQRVQAHSRVPTSIVPRAFIVIAIKLVFSMTTVFYA